MIPFGSEQLSHQCKLMSSLSSILGISWRQTWGDRNVQVSIANFHILCPAYHFLGNSASGSGQGMSCSSIKAQLSHIPISHGTDHSLTNSQQRDKFRGSEKYMPSCNI